MAVARWLWLILCTHNTGRIETHLRLLSAPVAITELNVSHDPVQASPKHPLRLPLSAYCPDCWPAFFCMACWLASSTDLTSVCLPFCLFQCQRKFHHHVVQMHQFLQRNGMASSHLRVSLPPTWRISGPSLLSSRHSISCPPSTSGARRAMRPTGSGCSCAKEYRVSTPASDVIWAQVCAVFGIETYVIPAAFHANAIVSDLLCGSGC